ncbi:S8 family peptidase [Chitinivorax sp. PXF-14]|uniref:S8 family peptidase n=1 Tax=Chitinivorax sp. PXF-14 TaxID=3230488 RepID=UPI003465A6FA
MTFAATTAVNYGIAHTDRLIIKYKPTVAAMAAGGIAVDRMAAAQRIGHGLGFTIKALRQTAGGAQVMQLDRKVTVAEAASLAAQIAAQDPTIEYAEPDRMMKRLFTPNDTRYNEQWEYYETTGGMRLPQAWDKSTGAGVIVAVIDTGYRPHADLAANIIGGYDFISDTAVSNDGDGRDADAKDPGDAVKAGECGSGEPAQDEPSSWHGTHVAGTIAALSNNGSGVAGVAFGAKVLPLRVLGKCGGYTSDIADAIIWASGGSVSGVPANPNKARVINMSLGGGGACDNTTQNAINSARSHGTVVVVAAGNENQDAANSNPANCSGVIAVAATNRQGGRAYYSNYGSVVDVAAPGGAMSSATDANGILSTLNAGQTAPGADSYAFYQGTSMATPHVAGVVALMLSKNPSLTPDDVESKLKATARAFPATCAQCGSGIVDANAAVDAAGSTTPPAGNSETESNNTISTANLVSSSGTTMNGTMGSSSDTDYFRVDLPAGKTLTATLTPSGSADYDLYLYNSAGSQIAKSTKGTGLVDGASVTNSGSATIARYARVVYYSGGTGAANGKYTLKLSW